jgi:small subunit ribosomal protein S20
MPNSNSAKKRLKQNGERRLRNRARMSDMRTQLRKVREAVSAGEIEKAETEFRSAAQKIDRAGARNLIHPNSAARTKSRLQKLIKAAKTAS